MQRHLVALHDIPPQGQEITVTEPQVWLAPIAEFGMDCRITTPLTARITLHPVPGGCLVRGTLTGEAVVPCDRCAEDTPVRIDHAIDTFAPLPDAPHVPGAKGAKPDAGIAMQAADDEDADADDPQETHVLWDKGIPYLNTASLCWEEFMLALPLRPLCAPQCMGLCSQCGANLNHGQCQCEQETGDPRLAVLRNFKVHKTEPTSDH